MLNISEDTEQVGCLCTVAGSVKWYNHFRKQPISSKDKCVLPLGPYIPIYLLTKLCPYDFYTGIHVIFFFFNFYLWFLFDFALSPSRWDLVPWPEIKHGPLHWELSLSHWTTREAPIHSIFSSYCHKLETTEIAINR